MALESLQDIMARKSFSPPDEVIAIKDYVTRRYKTKCKVTVHRGNITLAVPNSALAATLQLEKPKIIKVCGISGKLFIRTGH